MHHHKLADIIESVMGCLRKEPVPVIIPSRITCSGFERAVHIAIIGMMKCVVGTNLVDNVRLAGILLKLIEGGRADLIKPRSICAADRTSQKSFSDQFPALVQDANRK